MSKSIQNNNNNKAQNTMNICSHPASFRVKSNLRMCASCGKTFEKTDEQQDNTSSVLTSGGLQLQLSAAEAERVEQSKLKTLHSQRKLGLILDIDHTILHATQIPTTPAPEMMKKYELDSISICVDGIYNQSHLIKLRPHLHLFLKRVSKMFELSINTAGTRSYAERVVQLIDPDGTLFRKRIVSRSDGADLQSAAGLEKSLARTYVGDSSDLAVILDDREDVWKGQQGHQLLLIKPFLYFQGAREVNNASGQAPSFVESAVICLSENPAGSVRVIQSDGNNSADVLGFTIDMAAHHDDSLLRMMAVLEDIHTEYYSRYDSFSLDSSTPRDLKVSSILSRMKSKVLENCVITFSGIIPKNDLVPAEYTHFWRLAKSLGARVTHDVVPETTHLVTDTHQVKRTSSKVTSCIKKDSVFIVHTDWLAYSRFALCRVSERTFSLITGVPRSIFPSNNINNDSIVSLMTTTTHVDRSDSVGKLDGGLSSFVDVDETEEGSSSSSSEHERKKKRVCFTEAADNEPTSLLATNESTDDDDNTYAYRISEHALSSSSSSDNNSTGLGNDIGVATQVEDDCDEDDDDCFGDGFDEALSQNKQNAAVVL